jgi:uncharacterized protein
MKIYLHEITDQEKEFDFTHENSWVASTVLKVDEHLDGVLPFSNKRETHLHLSLRKVDDVIVVSGNIQTDIALVCSRCANFFKYPCQPSFSALFCKDPVMAGIAHLQHSGSILQKNVRPVGQNHGFARPVHEPEEDDAIPTHQDLDITYLSQEYIDLSDILLEQLQLQIPFQPLCKETCKGICSQCGIDLNTSQCQCPPAELTRPFSTLRDLKI